MQIDNNVFKLKQTTIATAILVGEKLFLAERLNSEKFYDTYGEEIVVESLSEEKALYVGLITPTPVYQSASMILNRQLRR